MKRCPRCGEPGGLINCSKCHTSRVAGVTWNAEKNLWSAQVKLGGYAQHVGYYADPEKAVEAIWARLGHSGVRDADGTDLEQDQRWDRVAGSDYAPDESFIPLAPHQREDVPGSADRAATSPLGPAGSSRLAGSTST